MPQELVDYFLLWNVLLQRDSVLYFFDFWIDRREWKCFGLMLTPRNLIMFILYQRHIFKNFKNQKQKHVLPKFFLQRVTHKAQISHGHDRVTWRKKHEHRAQICKRGSSNTGLKKKTSVRYQLKFLIIIRYKQSWKAREQKNLFLYYSFDLVQRTNNKNAREFRC